MGNRVVLDFSKTDYSDAFPCGNENLIHQSKMKQIISVWETLYEEAKLEAENCESDYKIRRHHNAISIFGSRGAGKTTFLLSVLKRIEDNYKDVLCLNPMDPSLIEMKQHPFINIIAAIQERIEKRFSEQECCCNPKTDVFKYKLLFKDCYKNMLRALPFIDGIGRKGVYEEWNDDEFISIQGMEKAEASNNLEESFHKYVRMALKILNKKCLVISFDDIDTEFKKGYEILEVIRKFLTSRQVVTIITGDLELYGKLVRKASWECFDSDFLRKEIDYSKRNVEEFSSMINQLENQYLVKILKPENRVLLKTVQEYLEEDDYILNIKLSTGEESDIKDSYNEFIRLIGLEVTNEKVKEEIVRFLSGLSLRVQIRILTLLNRLQLKKGKKIDLEASNGVLDIFWNDVNQRFPNAKALLKASPTYTIEMLKFLVGNQALYTGSNFLPETKDDILNKALFAISTRFNELVNKNRFLIFDYWIRISYVKVATEKIGGKDSQDTIKEFLKFTLLDADAGLKKSTGLAQAFCNYTLNGPFYEELETLPGIIFVGNYSPLQWVELNYVLSLLPIQGTLDVKQEESVFVSIYQLLAVIRDLLFAVKNYKADLFEKTLQYQLNKLGQYRNYLEPYNGSTPQRDAEKKELYRWGRLQIQETNPVLLKRLISDIEAWSSLNVKVSCQLLDRVFTRFYFTLINIDKNQSNYKSVGEQFHLYIIALLNAALVENAIDEGCGSINFNNIGDIESIYIENLQCFQDERKMYVHKEPYFYEWLFKCPLLNLFLNPLMSRLITDKKDYQILDQILRYSRIVTELNELKSRQQDWNIKSVKCEKSIQWMKNYYELKETEDDLSFWEIHKYMKDDSTKDIVQTILDLRKKKKWMRKNIENPLNLEDRILTFNTERSVVDEYYDIELQNERGIHSKLESIDKKIAELSEKENTIPDFIKKDYWEWLESNDGFKHSVYDILSSISLA